MKGQIIKKDGNTAILGMVASLLKDEVNAVRGIILIFQDITKILEMEDRVRRQERLATVGSLAAGIAHEIRNPLASLSGSIQVLQGELDLKGDNKHLMDIVVREADRLNTIITEFLEYARPQTNQNEQVVLSALLTETCTLLKNSRDFVPGYAITMRYRSDNHRPGGCATAPSGVLEPADQCMPGNAVRAGNLRYAPFPFRISKTIRSGARSR